LFSIFQNSNQTSPNIKVVPNSLEHAWKSLNSNQFHLTRFWRSFTSGLTL
jgi:hypothetical protein